MILEAYVACIVNWLIETVELLKAWTACALKMVVPMVSSFMPNLPRLMQEYGYWAVNKLLILAILGT